MAILQIPITKAKGKFVEINTDDVSEGGDLPPDVFTEALIQGLKVLLNRGTSKITKSTYPDAAELSTAAEAKANEQKELVRTSKIRFTGQKKASGLSGVEKTESMRLARQLVKDEMKAAGIKISHVAASEITKAAKAVLESDLGKEIVAQAKANIAARGQVKIGSAINIKSLVHEDPALVAKAEEKKAEAKAGTLSAKQAGKVKARAKAQPNA